MILQVTRESGKHRYSILESDRGRKPDMIASYDSLLQAAMVMRYIKGAPMPPKDQQAALRYIFEWDVMETMKLTNITDG